MKLGPAQRNIKKSLGAEGKEQRNSRDKLTIKELSGNGLVLKMGANANIKQGLGRVQVLWYGYGA